MKIVWFCAAFLACALAVVGSHAANIKLEPLGLDRSVELGFVPTHLLFRPTSDHAVAIGPQVGGSQILTLDSVTFQQKHLDEVSYNVTAAVFTADGKILYVVGEQGGSSFASAVRLDEPGPKRVTTVSLDGKVSLPSLSVDSSGRLFVGDASAPTVTAIPSYVFDLTLTKNLTEIRASDYGAEIVQPYGGSRSVVVSDSLDLMFVVANDSPAVSAIELRGRNKVSDEYTSDGPSDGASPVPLSLSGPYTYRRSDQGDTTSLLVASHFEDTLTVLDVDPLFRTLDKVATASVAHDLVPGASIRFLAGTRLVPQSALVASSKDQTTILSGNLYSKQLVQFARTDYGLERIGVITLEAPPTNMAISQDGTRALVSLLARAMLISLEADTAGPFAENEDREKVRQLQRMLSEMGLPVGAVDGVQGPATDRALVRLQTNTGLEFPLDDLDRAIEVVTQIRDSCAKSGLRCLLQTQSPR